MVDSTEVLLLATVAQTVVITITLVVFIFQFRSQEKAIRESSYQALMGRYNDFVTSVIDKPEIARTLIERIPERNQSEEITREEASIYGHMLLAYGILEEAYLLYAKKWMDEDNWQQWAAWARAMALRPEFVAIHRVTQGTFDRRFHQFITKVLEEKDPSR